MTLTKKQTSQLLGILHDIERSHKYLERSDVVGIAHKIDDINKNGADYTINNLSCLEFCQGAVKNVRVMNKNIGSDIAGLELGLSNLKHFIEANNK